MKAISLHITGVVQGVGFRPFVYNLAESMGLSGWVLNSSEGVFCLVQGTPEVVDTFPDTLRTKAPPMSIIESMVAEEVEPETLTGFEIRHSERTEGAMTLVSPDVATCEACAHELVDSSDRRYRYPFINCTNCGPRFTIIEDIPYDRPMTTMADFPMCPECSAEYEDPSDRRFHAQPDACFICGPRLYLNSSLEGRLESDKDTPDDWLWNPESDVVPRPHRDRDVERKRSDEILTAAAKILLQGSILAIKGLGGFHVACDATNETAVSRLRERKNRWGKPLAIMVRDFQTAREFYEIGPEEESLLTGTVRPIVLLRLRPDVISPIAPSVAGELAEMGVMLPYTPLHHLLLSEVDRPLVMTSGNLSEEPIAADNAEALERLGRIADAFLLHDRGIYSRYDDSVLRVVSDFVEPVRRARGFAPYPLALSFTSDVDILAAGPEQKNTFTLVKGAHAFVSQHLGKMENAETLEHFEDTIALYERLFRIDPQLVAYDLHPEYLATKYAHTLDLPKVGVQHHHAHIAAVTAEHGIDEPVVGIAFDGTGYGTDKTIWGGEILLADWSSSTRTAHLMQVPMPGGDAAVKRPIRMAVGTMLGLDPELLKHPGAAPMLGRLADGEELLLRQMVERSVNCPLTSSMGRLFDSVAALIGIRDDALYQGQPAIELEAACDHDADGQYEFEIREGDPGIIDPIPVLSEVLQDIADGIPQGVIAMRFHRAVIRCIVVSARLATASAGTRKVALAGGVFMNRIVLGGAVRELSSAELVPLTHLKLPVNDGAVSFGQAVVAWSNRHEV